GEFWGGPFPQYSEGLSFLTRFVTHFSAPGFFFLMGAGMLLFSESRKRQGWPRAKISMHFLLRGSLLILMQFALENRAWALQPGWPPFPYYGVLFALGAAMILASLTLSLSPKWVLVTAAAFFIATEAAVPAVELFSVYDHTPTLVNFLLLPTYRGMVFYPILPWLELALFGIVFGHWINQDAQQGYTRGAKTGLAFLAAFVLILAFNGFGNIRPRAGSSWIDFLNVVKYPPSWAFTLLTTGVNLLVLAGFSKMKPALQRLAGPAAVFGRAPLFFYIAHLYLYAWMGLKFFPSGTSLVEMYPYWLLGLLVLYFPTRWFGNFKQRQPAGSFLKFL
ncbi:MAG: heparan-alpha-glucosaminide N-acetyltransferase domain-containing protein, partial [Anaerolineae bacterium]|nr:heparan-alpha-glucosaminide N-acetyltransferase domain-containing protein [Anaerolineae bacterium]